MSSIGKIFVVLNLVFSLVVLGVVGSILAKSNEFKAKFETEAAAHKAAVDSKDAEIAKISQDNKELNGDKRASDQQKADLGVQVENLKGQNTKLNADLSDFQTKMTQLQGDYQKFTSSLEALRTHNEALVAENSSMRDAKTAAEDKQSAAEQDLARANQQIESLNADVARMKAQITELESANAETSMQIEAAIQAGFDISKVRAQPQLDGVVESVNAGLGIVVLSLGSDVGVTRGMKFSVHGGGQYKGEVVVDDVYPDNCAARIIANVKGSHASIAAGDKATTRL